MLPNKHCILYNPYEVPPSIPHLVRRIPMARQASVVVTTASPFVARNSLLRASEYVRLPYVREGKRRKNSEAQITHRMRTNQEGEEW